MNRRFIEAFYLALIILICTSCDGGPVSLMENTPPSAEVSEPDVSLIPSKPSMRPAIDYRLVFPAESVFTCKTKYSSAEEPIHFSKDQVENGWISYERSLVPFSKNLLEHPDASLLMWVGIHEVMLESWEISLNDEWICYMYKGEMNHATGTFDPGGTGTIYSAMIGQSGGEYVFCFFWNNYIEAPFEKPLESFQENDPGYASVEDIRSFLSGIVVKESTECL